jgi:hypothetical protein
MLAQKVLVMEFTRERARFSIDGELALAWQYSEYLRALNFVASEQRNARF